MAEASALNIANSLLRPFCVMFGRMNVHIARPAFPTTQAAEGLPRRNWSVAEILPMMDAGIIKQHDRFKLIGGEFVPMSPKGVPRESVKKELNRYWAKALPPDIDMHSETTLYISETDFREPDFICWPRCITVKEIKPATIMLLVEASDSSLSYDLGRKAAIDAQNGIRGYWVANAPALSVRVHSLADGQTEADSFPHAEDFALTEPLTPALFAVRLSDLGLRPLME
jgi:Putative restriction endonuclease